MSCVFCGIVAGEIPSDRVAEGDDYVAFRDLAPAAPTHVLIIPKRHIAGIAATEPEDTDLLGRMLLAATEIARQEGISESGYRVVINEGADGGQTVGHLHIHVMGGRGMSWPPG